MAKKIILLDEEDIKILLDIVSREKQSLRNQRNRPAPITPLVVPQASDTYIVQIIDPSGLQSGATLTCPVYKRVRLLGVDSLQYAGFTLDIYNPSNTLIPLNTILGVNKDKFGTWIPALLGLADTLLVNPNSGITLQEDERGTGSGTGTGAANYPQQFPNTNILIVNGESGGTLTQLAPGVVLLDWLDASTTQEGVVNTEDNQTFYGLKGTIGGWISYADVTHSSFFNCKSSTTNPVNQFSFRLAPALNQGQIKWSPSSHADVWLYFTSGTSGSPHLTLYAWQTANVTAVDACYAVQNRTGTILTGVYGTTANGDTVSGGLITSIGGGASASITIGDAVGGGTIDCILFVDSSGNLTDDNGLQWDTTNKALTVALSGGAFASKVSLTNTAGAGLSAIFVDASNGFAALFGDGVHTVAICDGTHAITYSAGTPSDWATSAPADVWIALDRCATLLKTLNSGTGP